MTPFPKPTEVTSSFYEELGLKAGLEVHQQLQTAHKLFCPCLAGRYSRGVAQEIRRRIRPVCWQRGERKQHTSRMSNLDKEILYQLDDETVCTCEMDESPPFGLNEEALEMALEVALLLGCELVDEVHVMRKLCLDGSFPAGFQRTALLALHGAIPYRNRSIGIQYLALEEDSCRQVSHQGSARVYRTDRLSMPLLEVVTRPDLRTPAEAVEVGRLLWESTHSTGKVRRGAGAARQDLNVSIDGGTPVEIKGVQAIPLIAPLIHYEALRQQELLSLRDLCLQRDVYPHEYKEDILVQEVSSSLQEVTPAPFSPTLAQGGACFLVRLPRLRGIIERPLGPDFPLAREFSDRLRILAGLASLPNLLYESSAPPSASSSSLPSASSTVPPSASSSAPRPSASPAPVSFASPLDSPDQTSPRPALSWFSPDLWSSLRSLVNAHDEDQLLLLWGPLEEARKGAQEIVCRAVELLEGVPPESRQVRHDGTTHFQRLLPLTPQLYPESEVPPLSLSPQRLQAIESDLPPPAWKARPQLRRLGLSPDVITGLLREGRLRLFEQIRRINDKVHPTIWGELLIRWPRALRRAGLPMEQLSEQRFLALASLYAMGRYHREIMSALLAETALHPEIPVKDLLQQHLKITPLSPSRFQQQLPSLLQGPPPDTSSPQALHRFWMGRVMASVRGRIPGALVSEVLRDYLASQGAKKP